MTLLEVVPNVSEGRDAASIEAIGRALGAEPGVRLLDVSSDPDHHRSVFTAAGEPAPLERGLLAMAREAVARIDLRRHSGVHPRLGAVDVVPFVPLGSAEMTDAVAAAHRLGRAIGDQLDLPVFLYGEAATDSERRLPASLRRHGLDAVAAALAAATLRPDYGPARAHPTAGVVLIGARTFLIAFNVWLAAPTFASLVRWRAPSESATAGSPACRRWASTSTSRRRAQVSINLLRPAETPLQTVIERVREEAAARGVEIERGELIGLLPEAIAAQSTADALLLPELGGGSDPRAASKRTVGLTLASPSTMRRGMPSKLPEDIVTTTSPGWLEPSTPSRTAAMLGARHDAHTGTLEPRRAARRSRAAPRRAGDRRGRSARGGRRRRCENARS